MKDFDFFESGLHLKFRITDEGRALLLHCSNLPYDEQAIILRNQSPSSYPEADDNVSASNLAVFTPVEFLCSGGQFNDHHGAKKTKSDGEARLRFAGLTDEYQGKWRHITLQLVSEEAQLSCHYMMFRQAPVIKSYTEVKAKVPLSIEYLSSFKLMGIGAAHGGDAYENISVGIPHNAWHGEGQWRFSTLNQQGLTGCHNYFYMKKFSYGNAGSWPSKDYLPAGIVKDKNQLIFWQVESNGSWYSEISNMRGFLYLSLFGPTFAESHWTKDLSAGESFCSVPVALSFTPDLNSAIEAMTAYRRTMVSPHKDDIDLPVQYNDYMHANWSNPRPERLFKQIDTAAELAMKYFVIDAGWYSDGDWWDTLGEWKEAEKRFLPYSLAQIYDYIRSKGMHGGIWLEIESVGINCPNVSELLPLCMKRKGLPVIDHDRYFLDFSLAETRSYADSVIDRLVELYGIRYIKMDYNVDCSVGCDNNAESYGQGLLQHNRCYLEWIEGVQRRHEGLIIEACASGGTRLDYATFSKHTIANTSDQVYYNRNPYILCNLSGYMLPEQLGAWCYPRASEDAEQVIMNLVNAIPFRMQLSGEIEQLSPDMKRLVAEGVEVHNSLADFKKRATAYLPLGFCEFFQDTVVYGLKDSNRLVLCVYNLGGERKKSIELDGIKPLSAKILFPYGSTDSVRLDKNILNIELGKNECARVVDIELEG